jgi:hypothetical protein
VATRIVESEHYAIAIQVQKVQHIQTTTPDGPRLHVKPERKVGTVVNVNITGPDLMKLIMKGVRHLELVEAEDGNIVLETDNSGKR